MSEWHEQERNAVCDVKELKRHISLTSRESEGLENVCNIFKMKITPHYLSLIDKENPLDPLRKMAVPSMEELRTKKDELDDPIGDERVDRMGPQKSGSPLA